MGFFANQTFQGKRPVVQSTGEGLPEGFGQNQVLLCVMSLHLPVDRVSTDCIAQLLSAPVTKPVTRTLMGICSNSPVNH